MPANSPATKLLPPSGCADPLDSYTVFTQIYNGQRRMEENFREKSTDMHTGIATPADLVDEQTGPPGDAGHA